ncbi:AraC family transcriptional regulator [Phenylobacterium terrae]|uniref:AraC family transcriptional regulator n=1 Tax=Phenylobacterium terrae TaxID=2665495 RepID=A0ABW4N1K4_9CAUL
MSPGCAMAVRAAELTVGAGFARGLLEFAVSKGAGRDELMARAGLSPDDLAAQDGRVPWTRYVALMRAGKALTGDPALALHYGEAVEISQVSIVGLIGRAADTVMDSFATLNRFVRLIVETENEGPGERFQLRRDRAGLWMVDTRKDADAFPELTESWLAQMICGPRRYDPRKWVKAAHVTHAAPAHAAEYEKVLGVPVTFGSDRNAMLIEEASLDAPVAYLPKYVKGVLTGHADALLRELEASKTTRGRVEALLKPMLHSGQASMDLVAGQLGLSRQTLFRRLKAEGVTFEQVLDELRCRLARDYLTGRRLSVNETAYLLGFSDPAAFSRAFKRWTGESPSAAREPDGDR